MKSPEKLIINDFSNGTHFENFRIMADGSLRKREGYKLLYTFDAPLRGAISVRDNGRETIYAVAGKKLYRITDTDGFNVSMLGTLISMYFANASERVEMFMFNRNVYILGGGNYYRLTPTSLAMVEGYVPLIRINATANDLGVEYERQNLLTNKVRMRFRPNGTARQYNLFGSVYSVDNVYLNGVSIEGSLYTSGSQSYVSFSSPLEVTDDNDVLEVYYTLSGTSRRSEIISCKHSAVYGGDTDSRIFLYGGDLPSVIFPSEPEGADTMQTISAEYFPMGGEITVGDGNLYVSGAVRQFDRLAIFTEDGAFYTYPREETPVQGIPRFTFPILPLNSDVGATKDGCAVLVENEPFALNENGLFRFKSTSVRDERLAILEEAPDFVGLTRSFIDSCSLYVNRLRGELWCCGRGDHAGRIVIYNARLDRWYCFSGIAPDFMFTYYSEPAFGIGANLYHFSADSLTDNGIPFDAIYQSTSLSLSNAFDIKTLYEFGISVERVPNASFICMLNSDKGETHTMDFTVTNNSPRVDAPSVLRSHARLSHASYVTFQIVLTSNSPPADVYEVILRYRSL